MDSNNCCLKCRFYEGATNAWGHCLVNPPVAYMGSDSALATFGKAVWPIVMAGDRCGKWEVE